MAKTKRDKSKHRSSADFMIASGNDVPFNYVESFKSLRTNLNYRNKSLNSEIPAGE